MKGIIYIIKSLIVLVILYTSSFGQNLKEQVKLGDGRVLHLYTNGTFKFVNKDSSPKKFTYEELRKSLKGKTMIQVKEMLGKPTRSNANQQLTDDNNKWVSPITYKDYGTAESWYYSYNWNGGILYNPITERYEDLLIYFYKGKVYSVIRDEEF